MDTYIGCAYKPASPLGWMTFLGQIDNRIEESDREKWAIVSFMILVETFRETSRNKSCMNANDLNIKCLKIERFAYRNHPAFRGLGFEGVGWMIKL